MKFRNPKTGEVFQTVLRAWKNYCRTRRCESCPLKRAVEESDCGLNCDIFADEHPNEAATLMGYEVIPEPGDNTVSINDAAKAFAKLGQEAFNQIGKESNMSKPLKDWTLEEVRDFCKKHDCTPDCPLKKGDGECKINRLNPCDWNLDEKPRFTQQDIEDALTIQQVFGREGIVRRQSKATTPPYSNLTFDYAYINEAMFPSIKEGQEYSLDEIIGCDILKGND